MTPKEKAKELVYKYQSLVTTWDCYHDVELTINEKLPTMKLCALIAVDETLNFDIRAKTESQFVIENRIADYWNEVKEEINKL